jgi:hypothetical protein
VRALVLALALVGCSGAEPSVDGGAHDAAAVDANRADAGFDPSTLPPCTLVGTRTDLELAPLLSTGTAPADALEQRAFYVLTILRADASVRAALDADAALTTIASDRESALRDAASTCGPDAACLRAGVAISASDSDAAITATLAALDGAALTASVAATLRGSHFVERFAAEDDATLIRTALEEAVVALHAALDAYAISELAPTDLEDVVSTVAGAAAGSLAWWEPLSRTTIEATLRAGRDEAVRYEPIEDGENAAALAGLPSIDWTAFPYAALIVPGQGPTDAETRLNPAGAARADLAADRWDAGLAPLIVLSGGHVHPDRTLYSEAIEMKHYLMATRGIPESALFVDPYARHTTTNLRNVTRVLLRAGVATDARVLVVTDLFQTLYIRDAGFAMRCDDELHFRPYEALEALSSNDTCMTIAAVSLTTDASDLLDP